MQDINKYYFEFSRLYIRIMRLETNIKQNLIHSLLPFYKDDIINVFSNFFNNKKRLQRYQFENINRLSSILKNPQITSDSKKFITIINNVLYLSDLIFIFLYCKQFRNPEIIKKFYYNIPEKYEKLISNRQLLLDLRNSIAHFKFKDFQSHKNEYMNALKTYESYIGHNIPGITILPDLSFKPSLKEILNVIYILNPSLFDKNTENKYNCNRDRLLLEICDEIALYNGYEVEELHSPWSILREKYRVCSNKITR